MASQGDKITYFLVGGFVGAAIALLFAPKTGEETRKYLETRYRDGSEKLSERARDGREYLEQKKEWVSERAKEGKEKLDAKSRKVVETVGESIDKGKEAIDKGKEAITQKKASIANAVKAGRKAYVEGKERLNADVVDEEA